LDQQNLNIQTGYAPANEAGVEPPFSSNPCCLNDYAQQIHPKNLFKSLAPLVYIHDRPHVKGCNDTVLPHHFDLQNCPLVHFDWACVAWRCFFVPSIGHNVTLIISTTTRKSISDTYKRNEIICTAANWLLQKYELT
jgi:hypothetical protein